MQLILLSLILATAPVKVLPDQECKTVIVCPTKKKAVVKKKASVKTAVDQQKQKQKQDQHQSQTVIVNVTQPAQAEVKVLPASFSFGLGLRGAVGLWTCNPNVFALVGLRLRIPPAHLGFELNTQFYWGHSAQVMLYPVQGPVSWHIDAGVLWFYHNSFSAQDVARRWDMLVGTGLEFRILPHLSLTADWRMTFPNAFDMTRLAYPDADGKYLNVGNVVGNSFLRSQLLLGVMVHTW